MLPGAGQIHEISVQAGRSALLDAEPTRAEFPELSGAEIAGLVHGKRVGGDFYQFCGPHRERVVFGLLDVAGDCNENRGIVAAARATFREKGPACLANDVVNEADAMMEFCHELNHEYPAALPAGVRSCAAFLGCYNEDLGHGVLRERRSHSRTAAVWLQT